MALISRRLIQKYINKIRFLFTKEQIKDLLTNLNACDRQSLDREWEIILLAALIEIGSIDYEKNHGGSRKPDFTYFSKQNSLYFCSDITVISDKSYHDINPFHFFQKEVYKIFSKNGIYQGIDIQCKRGSKYIQKGKIHIALPAKNEIPNFVKNNLTS